MKSPLLGQYLLVPLYVRVEKNRFRVRHVGTGREATVSASRPFTTTRLLVGEFSIAQETLRSAVKQVVNGRWWAPSPTILMQPLEMTEGGLAQVEERILRELAMAAGAVRVVVFAGTPLSDQQVMQKLQ